jgi:hypothetical protein
MSNEVDLRLVADAKPYVDATRQAMNANQTLYNQVKQNAEFEKRNIAEIQAAIYQYSEAKRKATNPKEQEMYNRKLAEAKVHLNEAKVNAEKYAQEQKKLGKELEQSEKKQSIFSTGLGKLVGIVGGVTGAWTIFKNVMASTQATGDAMAQVFEGVSFSVTSLMRSISSLEFSGLISRMAEAYEAGRKYAKGLDEISDRERSVNIQRVKISGDMLEARTQMQEAIGRKDEEAYQKYREQYVKGSEELLEADKKIAELRLDNFRKYVLGIKQVQDKETGQLRNLKEGEIDLMVKYVEEYNKLTDEELANAENYLKIKTELDKKSEDFGWGKSWLDKQQPEFKKAKAAVKEANDAIIASEREKIGVLAAGYADLKGAINEFSDKERDALADILKANDTARNERERHNKALVRGDIQMNRMLKAEADRAAMEKKQDAEKLAAEILKITDENEQKRIALLEGIPRIDAEEQYNLKRIAQTKASLEQLGVLNQEALDQLALMEDFARQEAETKRQEYRRQNIEYLQKDATEQARIEAEKNAKIKALDQELADWQDQVERTRIKFTAKNPELQLLIYERNQKLKLIDDLINKEEDYTNMTQEEINKRSQIRAHETAQLQMEVDDMGEQIRKKELHLQQYSQAFTIAFNQITSMLQSTYNMQLQFFQRERQMMDTRISELQRTIDQEMEARDKGYANNVDGKRKELEALQLEREKAFEKEQKIAEAQRKLNEIIQISQLVTSSANIFATFSTVPGGTAIAIALIALMLGAYVKAKVDARKLAALEKGGSGTKTGMVTGKRHSQGGENFTDHVELEDGEVFGVLSRPSTGTYGKDFHKVVDAFNSNDLRKLPRYMLKMPEPRVTVNTQAQKLETLEKAMRDVETAIKSQPQIYHVGSKRIERKGRNTRIINNA